MFFDSKQAGLEGDRQWGDGRTEEGASILITVKKEKKSVHMFKRFIWTLFITPGS